MSEELPLIVFITSARCGHCISFRGTDGRPDKSKPWNYEYIRMLLNKYPSKTNPQLKRRASSILEINVSSFQNNIDNIYELNIYTAIPSIPELNAIIMKGKITNYRFFDENDIIGNSVERINIKRGTFDSIQISVDVDGKFSKYMTDININEYIWMQTPQEIQIMRECIKEGIEIPSDLFLSIKDNNLKNFVESHYKDYSVDIRLFDQHLLTHYFNFPWLLSKILAKQIRRYENFYPCWMLVSPEEWKLSILDDKRPIFARMTNHTTFLTSNGYSIKPFTQGESIDILLKSFEMGTVNLKYDSSVEKVKVYSWQVK